MLAKNKSGWKLIEYIDIKEEDIQQYQNVTGAYAILKVADKYVIGYNDWRQQWEFPAGGIDAGETPRQAAIRELYEETHQRNEALKFKGLFKVEDAKGNIKYQAIFIGEQAEIIPFERKENDEISEIRLWDMQEDVGYVDECDVKIAQIVFE
ncbi:MAG: NUDIX hydrolase [Lachnospiraceae bacterium]|nr:NUDIX hydrolase [Lachnospiraceae bacterium]